MEKITIVVKTLIPKGRNVLEIILNKLEEPEFDSNEFEIRWRSLFGASTKEPFLG